MKKVLVLGAGMVARPLVRYLLDRGFGVTQGDLAPGRASAMIDGHPHGTRAGPGPARHRRGGVAAWPRTT